GAFASGRHRERAGGDAALALVEPRPHDGFGLDVRGAGEPQGSGRLRLVQRDPRVAQDLLGLVVVVHAYSRRAVRWALAMVARASRSSRPTATAASTRARSTAPESSNWAPSNALQAAQNRRPFRSPGCASSTVRTSPSIRRPSCAVPSGTAARRRGGGGGRMSRSSGSGIGYTVGSSKSGCRP